MFFIPSRKETIVVNKKLIFLTIVVFCLFFVYPNTGQSQKILWEFTIREDGSVHVRLTSQQASQIVLPITFQNLQVSGSEYEVDTNLQNYIATVELNTAQTDSIIMEYDWPDGALPNYKKSALWFFEIFKPTKHSCGRIVLPAGASVVKKDFRNCVGSVVQEAGKIKINFRATGSRPLVRVVYEFPWRNKFKKEQVEHLTIYYPDVSPFNQRYSAILHKFIEDSHDVYQKYQKYLHWAPDSVDICFVHPTAVWYANPIAGACTYMGKHPIIWYPYRALAGYEFPPQTSPHKMMGMYHEMAHAFQPPVGLPNWLGGHVWTGMLTYEYDQKYWPSFLQEQKKGKELLENYLAKGETFLWQDDWGNRGDEATAIGTQIVNQLRLKYGWRLWQKFFALIRRDNLNFSIITEAKNRNNLIVYYLSLAAGEDLTEQFRQWSFPVVSGRTIRSKIDKLKVSAQKNKFLKLLLDWAEVAMKRGDFSRAEELAVEAGNLAQGRKSTKLTKWMPIIETLSKFKQEPTSKPEAIGLYTVASVAFLRGELNKAKILAEQALICSAGGDSKPLNAVLLWPASYRGVSKLVEECFTKSGVMVLNAPEVANQKILPKLFPLIFIPSNADGQNWLTKEMVQDYLKQGGVVITFHGGDKNWLPVGEYTENGAGADFQLLQPQHPLFNIPHKINISELKKLEDANCHCLQCWYGIFENLPSDASIVAVAPDGQPLLAEVKIGKGKILFSSFYPDLLYQMDPKKNKTALLFLENFVEYGKKRR